ncbi:MAG: zinc ABC transporter substrate-binding protein [Aquabacterium sp.]|nr:zinc ABC transporter substrate-binding protein [Aquabacterium sp.]
MMFLPRRRRAIGLIAACALPLHAAAQTPDAAPLRVVASFSLLANMVAVVGGDAVVVHALVGPDADAHAFTPAPADAQRLAQAGLIVVNGLGFEGWIDRLVRASGSKAPVLVASQGITVRRIGKVVDPHAWQSLVAAQRYVENIRVALIAARPAQSTAINARAAAYIQQLAALDARVRGRLAPIPADQRKLVTAHNAFGYMADAWGLDMRAAQGWSTAGEASAADVARLIRQLKAQRVRALFVENISDPRLVERIAQEAGATVGGTLYSDALSPPGTRADAYLKLMAHNAETLLTALQPAR